MLIDKFCLIADSHTQTNFREISFPERRQFGFLCVKPSLAASEIVLIFVGPKVRHVMEGSLKDKSEILHKIQLICRVIAFLIVFSFFCSLEKFRLI